MSQTSFDSTPAHGAVLGHELLDHEQSRGRIERLATGAQDLERALVVPVVQHVLEEVRVAARRHGFEERAACKLDPVRHTGGGEVCARARDNMRLVEQDRAAPGVAREDLADVGAVVAADVDEQLGRGEVVRAQDRVDPLALVAQHRPVEALAELGELLAMFPHRHPEQLVEGGLAVANAAGEPSPRRQVLLVDQRAQVAHALELEPRLGQRELAVAQFDHGQRHQHPQQAMQRRRVRVEPRAQLALGARSLQLRDDPELGRGDQDACCAEPQHEALDRRGGHGSADCARMRATSLATEHSPAKIASIGNFTASSRWIRASAWRPLSESPPRL